jgi:hypothetical protein
MKPGFDSCAAKPIAHHVVKGASGLPGSSSWQAGKPAHHLFKVVEQRVALEHQTPS